MINILRNDIIDKDKNLFQILMNYAYSFSGLNEEWKRHKYVERFENSIVNFSFGTKNSVNNLYEEGYYLTQIGEFELSKINDISTYPTIKSYVDNLLNSHISNIEKHILKTINNVKASTEEMKASGLGIPYQVSSMLDDVDNYLKKYREINNILIRITKTESYDFNLTDENELTVETSTILSAIFNMGLNFARYPQHYSSQGEENLRSTIAVALSSIPGIDATAETLNRAGKTDIRVTDLYTKQTRLIAECKIWSGGSDAYKAINQLLGYITTYDANSCLIFFVKNKEFLKVVDNVAAFIPSHNNHIQTFLDEQTGWKKYMFSKLDDRMSYFNLDVMLFHIPDITFSS